MAETTRARSNGASNCGGQTRLSSHSVRESSVRQRKQRPQECVDALDVVGVIAVELHDGGIAFSFASEETLLFQQS
jgi:hypothetical protein